MIVGEGDDDDDFIIEGDFKITDEKEKKNLLKLELMMLL